MPAKCYRIVTVMLHNCVSTQLRFHEIVRILYVICYDYLFACKEPPRRGELHQIWLSFSLIVTILLQTCAWILLGIERQFPSNGTVLSLARKSSSFWTIGKYDGLIYTRPVPLLLGEIDTVKTLAKQRFV